jgi:hypothetical protein
MDLRDAVLRFHQGEIIKTMLINAGNLTGELAKIDGKDRAAAVKLYKGVLEQIRGEIKLASAMTGLTSLSGVDSKVRDAIWEIHINRLEEANRLLGEAIAGTVTTIQSAAVQLYQEGLI